MCRFQSEVRGRGERADSPLSLCRIPKARRISGSSQGASAKSPGQHCRERCLAVFPFSVRGQSITVLIMRSEDPQQSLSFVWGEGEKSRPRTNKTRGQRGGSETLTYVCYDRNLWELNEKKDASAA